MKRLHPISGQTGEGAVHRCGLSREKLTALAMLWPSLMGVLLFFVLPFGVICYYSVIDSPLRHNFVFLDNFVKLLHNTAFLTAAKNTLVFSAMAVPLAVILALALALLMEARIPLKSQFRTFFLSPMMVPVASVVLIWQVLFDHNGVLNNVLMNWGLAGVDWLNSPLCKLPIVVLFLWKNLGYNMILFMAALANIPRELLEVASLDTNSQWYIFTRIKLRYLSPTILFVTILSLINSFKIFREVYLLTGNYPYDGLYMLQHFMNNTFLDYPKLSAAAVIMAIAMVIIIAVLFVVEDSYGKDVEG